MEHVMARLAGYGVVLMPYWPYTFARSEGAPDAVLVTNWREDGPAMALVDPADPHSDVQVIEVAYEHGTEQWWQGLYLLPRKGGRVLVFTAQSRGPGIAAARHGLEWMLALE